MNPLRALLAALTPEIQEHDTRMRAVGASLKALRSDVRALHREAAAAAGRAEALSRQLAQLRRLQEGGGETAAHLDELAGVLGADRVAAHLRAAVQGAPRNDELVPRLAIEGLWPDDVYQVLTEAIPDPVFFEGAAPGVRTLRVPPRLAPVSAIAIWTFVAKMIDDVVVAAAAARFADLLTTPLDITPGRLVRREAGAPPPPSPAKGWQQGHLVIHFAPLGSPAANAASVTVGGAGAADAVPCDGTRCTYELWFGSNPA